HPAPHPDSMPTPETEISPHVPRARRWVYAPDLEQIERREKARLRGARVRICLLYTADAAADVVTV
ncbi:hypothetical protein AAHH78_37535, partial [Burkholderia pseudomallei]